MPDWMTDAVTSPDPTVPPALVLAFRAGLAIVLGLVVAGVYWLTFGRRSGTGGLTTTLVLLTVLIALVTVVIGNSVARAFGLAGVLSIVRFRTVVEDTRDTAFVIFAVVVGMAAGVGYLTVAVIGIVAVGLAAALMRRLDRGGDRAADLKLTVRVGLGEDPAAALGPVFAKYRLAPRLTGVETTKTGTALEFTYAVPPADPAAMAGFVSEAYRVEGVQGVELRG